MKLDFNFKLKGLDGKEIQDGQVNKILANVLSQMNTGNSIKLYDWALKLWNGGTLEADDSDANVLKEIIETSELLTVLAKVPMMDVIKIEQKKIEDDQERTKKQQGKKH